VLNLLAEYCQTRPGKSKALNLRAFDNPILAQVELNRIDEILKSGEMVDFYIPFDLGELKGMLDIYPYLDVEIITTLKAFLTHIRTLKKRHEKGKLKQYFNKFHDYDEIIEEINSKIDDNKEIKDDASSLLYKIRMRKKALHNQILGILREILASQSYLFTDLNIVVRNGRYTLPVRTNLKSHLPGIVHAYSNSGETVFIEPFQITEFDAELIELDRKEQDEIVNILKGLTKKIKLIIQEIESDIDYAASLDLLFAKARYASIYNCSMPLFGDAMNIKNGYHPLLKHLKKDAVPLNLPLPEDKKVLLISGPNAGGKTVVLKTVGILSLMAKCGLFIPADEGTVIPFFDNIFADIGDEQSIESDLSTFAGHLLQIKSALESKDGYNLVLLDELMNQTSVEEGSALASAILEELAERNNIVLATTHNENLKIFVSKRPHMLNAGMEFIDRPTYRLILGIPQPSNAIKLAQQMGFDNKVIEKAKSYIDNEKESLNELFETLSKELSIVQEERNKLESLISEYESKLTEIQLRKKKELRELQEKYQKELLKAKHRVEELIRNLKRDGAKPEIVREAKEFFAEELEKKEMNTPYYPKIGEMVKIKGSNKPGVVLAQHQGRYKIGFDNLFFWAKPEEIEPGSEE